MTARRTPIVQQAVATLLVAALGGYPVRALADQGAPVQGVPVQSVPPPPAYAPAPAAPPQSYAPAPQQSYAPAPQHSNAPTKTATQRAGEYAESTAICSRNARN